MSRNPTNQDTNRSAPHHVGEPPRHPHAQLSRTQQLAQLTRRFGPSAPGLIELKPSDPDFVFPLDRLRFALHVPETGKSWIRVLNTNVPAACRKSVDRGWQRIADRDTTLLRMVNMLDRELEALLSRPVDGDDGAGAVVGIVRPMKDLRIGGRALSPSSPAPTPTKAPTPAPAPRPISPSQRTAATAKRTRDLRQLTARLSPSPIFSQLSDTTYIIPLNPSKPHLLPVPLQPLHSVRLVVPTDYGLVQPRIELTGVPEDIAWLVEAKFESYAAANPAVGLTSLVNVLAGKLHEWAFEQEEGEQSVVVETAEKSEEEKKGVILVESDEKTHIEVIVRPPEWSFPEDPDYESTDGEFSSEDFPDGEGGKAKGGGEVEAGDAGGSNVERGTSLSCPGIQLSGIDLLEVSALNVTIKCGRCKTEQDIMNLKGTAPNEWALPRGLRCEKCSDVLGIGFRKEFLHQSSQRLGFFDLVNCTISQLLLSDFLPHCDNCSSDAAATELKGIVRGQNTFTNCRSCFKRMSVLIPEFKLLRISMGANSKLLKVPVKKAREERYIAGTELPLKGRCRHYRKSTRWFRFSCCSKVYPCDRCHDAKESHSSEHANRMICGLCSREQNYRPEDCRYCGNTFVKKTFSHYWEGGKGTRDRRLMNRNDPRKYKRTSKPLE